jgi:hypothetical protein
VVLCSRDAVGAGGRAELDLGRRAVTAVEFNRSAKRRSGRPSWTLSRCPQARYSYYTFTEETDAHRRIGAILERLRRGENH